MDKNVPELRFKEYFEVWLEKPLSTYVTSQHGGASLKPSDFVNKSEFEVIPKKAIIAGGKLKLDPLNPTYSSESFFKKNKKAVIDSNYLVTTLRDLVPTAPSIGLIVRNLYTRDLLLAQGVHGFQISENLSPGFLTNLSNKISFRRMMYRLSVGSTQVHLRSSEFFQIKLLFPDVKEQKKIADFLSAVDNKIRLLTEKQSHLQRYKKGVMQKLFSQEFRFKDENGEDFGDWEENCFGELGKFTGGGTPSTDNVEYWNGKTPWISSSDIGENHISKVSITRFINDKAIKESATKVIPPNSILLVSRVGVGKLAVTQIEVCTSQDFTSFTPHEDDVRYIAYFILFNKNMLHRFSQGTSIKGFTTKDIGLMKIDTPVLKEQKKIAKFIDEIGKKIDSVTKQIEQTKTFKKGLLQQMFV